MTVFFANGLLPFISYSLFTTHATVFPYISQSSCRHTYSPMAGGPARPLLMFYQPCLLLPVAVLEHYELSKFLLEHSVSEYNLLCIFYTYTF
jgi:hypothetical protein